MSLQLAATLSLKDFETNLELHVTPIFNGFNHLGLLGEKMCFTRRNAQSERTEIYSILSDPH